MSHATIDDRLPFHEKLEPLMDNPRAWSDALSVYLAVLCDCQWRATDGKILFGRLATLTPHGKRAIKIAKKLVELKLFEDTKGGFCVHDFLDHNPSKAERLAKTELKTDRQRRWRAGKKKNVDASVDASTPHLPETRLKGVSVDAAPTPTPTPIPPPISPPVDFDIGLQASTFDAESRKAGYGPYVKKHSDYRRAEDALEEVRAIVEEVGGPIEEVARDSIRRYFRAADSGLKEKGCPFWGWAQRPAYWYRAQPKGPARATSREEWVDFDDDFDDLVGEAANG